MRRFEVLRTITPHGGIAKTPLELAKRSREIIADEAHWITGGMFCSTAPKGSADYMTAEELADEIMRKGVCGEGWGVCAVGAVSLVAGLNAVVINGRSTARAVESPASTVESLVIETGEAAIPNAIHNTVEWIGPRPAKVRQERYKKVLAALNDATPQHTGKDQTVWEANDDGIDHAEIVAIFDTAIEALSRTASATR